MQGNHDHCRVAETWHEELSPLKYGADNSVYKSINMVERVFIVILVRHDYPNNASILGELYNTWVLAHVLATFLTFSQQLLPVFHKAQNSQNGT